MTAQKRNNKEKQKQKRNPKQSFQQELLALQKEQTNAHKEQEERHEKFLKDMMEEQRRIDQEERDKDRDFFLKLGQLLKLLNIF